MTKQVEHKMAIFPPKTSDFLPESIKSYVRTIALKNPVTVYLIAIGASCGFVGWLFGMQMLYFGMAGGIFAGIFWALAQIFIFNDKIGKKYIKQLNIRQNTYEQFLRKMVESGLQECLSVKEVEKFVLQGINQCINIKEKLNSVQELLDLKLKKEEITYGRFLGAAELVHLSVLDNLKDIISILKSSGSINDDYIQERFTEIGGIDNHTQDDMNQKQTLEKRLELKEKQLARVKHLLTRNEEAMTEMEVISSEVAQWKSDHRFSDVSFESAISRLQELAQHAHEYNE